MGFFDTEEGVQEYLEMAKGHDGRELIEKLSEYLRPGSTVLELGMGPGKDLELLSKRYEVTGSDNSKLFVEIYKKANPAADLLLLDAVTLDTDRRFDCIFSNKVLQHLERENLERSVPRQAEVLEDGGLLAHAMWFGNKIEDLGGLHFQYYEEADLEEIFEGFFDVVLMERYEELDPGDSIFVILKKSNHIPDVIPSELASLSRSE
jgi:cyclopropane fatty-acyl-phospholipid synthase-like methyltransferase